MAYYLDTSALVKLVVHEEETPALVAWVTHQREPLVTCDLARTELLRATRRAAPERMQAARDVLGRLTILSRGARGFDAAGLLDPPLLRTLDAIHLTSAQEIGDDLDGLVTYDARMADAARSVGLPVMAPS